MIAAPPVPPALVEIAHGDHDFAAALYKASAPASGNVFLSPLSVRIALAMTAAGALGDTTAEMQRVLYLGKSTETNNAGFSALLAGLANRGKVTVPDTAHDWEREEAMQRAFELHLVDRLWAQSGYPILPAFTKTLETSFRAPLEQLDFANDLENSRLKINDWVAGQTANKILNLIAKESLKPDVRLVLTNAIYFKARWLETFSERATADADFFSGPAPVKVKTMRQTKRFGYAEVKGTKLLELPYADGSLSMVIALPAANDGLPALEQSLDGKTLDRWIAALHIERVSVFLPKFKMTSSFLLSQTLQKMGMSTAFTFGPADFGGIDGKRDFFIGEVIHQAFIDLNEEGTEAAAATAVAMRAGSAMMREPDPKVFKADHPFFFFIRDLKSGTILFAGRVLDPG